MELKNEPLHCIIIAEDHITVDLENSWRHNCLIHITDKHSEVPGEAAAVLLTEEQVVKLSNQLASWLDRNEPFSGDVE